MDIKEAQDRLYSELKQNNDVVGIYNNDKTITVMILDAAIAVFIPTEYDGYKVIAVITEPIQLQDNLTF